jgi:hypothetical protein
MWFALEVEARFFEATASLRRSGCLWRSRGGIYRRRGFTVIGVEATISRAFARDTSGSPRVIRLSSWRLLPGIQPLSLIAFSKMSNCACSTHRGPTRRPGRAPGGGVAGGSKAASERAHGMRCSEGAALRRSPAISGIREEPPHLSPAKCLPVCLPHGFGVTIKWCRVRGSNPRPSVYKTAALPLC